MAQQMTLFVPAEGALETYFLRIGLYSPQNGARFQTPDGEFATIPLIFSSRFVALTS